MIIFLGNSTSRPLYQKLIDNSKGDPDIVVSCQHPDLVPASMIRNYTCVNIHYGALPQYAGCNPVYWQVRNEDQAGVTLHYMDEKFDTGDIIEIKRIPCGNLCADEVYNALAIEGASLFQKWYKCIINGTAPRLPQDLTKRKYYNKTDVNFKENKFYGPIFMDDRKVRALHYNGKQYPVVKVGGLNYELRRCE